jgi:hypothetical protein
VLTLIGILGLTVPPGAPASAPADTYALAVSTGSRLRLVPGAGYDAANATEQTTVRTLACDGVLRLGAVDVGYRCGALPPRESTTPTRSALQLAHARAL